MKTTNSLLVTVLLIFFMSCSSDDDDIQIISEEEISGTWIGMDVDYSGQTVTESQGQTVTTDFVGEAFDVDYTLDFNENPNTIQSMGSYSINLTTTVNGQTTMQVVENLEFLEDGNWTISGDQLTIENNGESQTATILALTENSLIISFTEEEDLSQAGVTVISTIDAIVTFTR